MHRQVDGDGEFVNLDNGAVDERGEGGTEAAGGADVDVEQLGQRFATQTLADVGRVGRTSGRVERAVQQARHLRLQIGRLARQRPRAKRRPAHQYRSLE